MIPAKRRALLMTLINESGYAQAANLAEELGVSQLTIRRDLQLMEKEGLVIRKRGGAISRNKSVTMELPYSIKRLQNLEIKKRIAKAALTMVEDGNSIILDSGSTTYALAQRLVAKNRLSVVTNDLYIATKLAANPDINLICTGGVARANVFSLQGALAELCIRDLRVEITFLGADAIHKNGGIFNVNIDEVPIKQAMIDAATKVVLIVDSSKFKVRGFARICDLSRIDTVITDDGMAAKTRQMIQDKIRGELIIV